MTGEKQKLSGRLTVRVPTDLHRDLVQAAEAAGVSLNQFISTALARTVGWSDWSDEATPAKTSIRGEEAVAEMWRNLLR